MENNNNKRELRSSAVAAGKRLKEAREKKALSIEQVQKQTKIHSTVLIGLEEGRVSDLLTDTYVRSFLKQYAQFLGVNSVELLKEYFPARSENPAPNTPLQNNGLSEETSQVPKFIYMTGLAVGAIILLAFLIFLVGKVSSAVKRPRAVVQKSSVTPVKKKQAQSASKAQKSKPAVKTSFESKDLIPKSSPMILEIRVKETVLVKLKRDGVLIFENVLTKGLVEKIIADHSIELDFAKASSLELTLNKRPIDLSGKRSISGIDITRKGVKLR